VRRVLRTAAPGPADRRWEPRTGAGTADGALGPQAAAQARGHGVSVCRARAPV